ncbi:ABC transporter substrate-binding protein [Agromyces sp. ZXT2-3]|uniref:ABC transporter substrate-binding protein n=1 Tax=Agromyces sp. ZXT2-3 TaxID=3461152 RepID=UPI0040551059
MAPRHLLAGAAVAALLTGCAAGGGTNVTADEGEITGEITVLTNRTDLVDTVFQDYAAEFTAEYPGTSVKFEAITDYEGEVTTRMSSTEYGDVLLIPNTVTRDQLPQFFEPLGDESELSGEYRFTQEQAFEGQVYGLSLGGVAEGVVYNKRIWEEAGVTEAPTTPDEFLAALEAVKGNGSIPFYTNYKDGWPLSIWNSQRAILADPSAATIVVESDAPWSEGEIQYITDGLLYDIVAAGLNEEDPLTTNWEESKTLLGTGEVSAMLLGSWSIGQMQAAAEDAGASADDIGFLPFPYQTDGSFHAQAGGDYKAGINVNSDNKATARAWIDWFIAESGFAQSQGMIPADLDGEFPPALQDFIDSGVELVTLDPAPDDMATAEEDVMAASEIDLRGQIYRQQLVDVARGAADGDKESFFDELNARWSDARDEVLG